MVEILETQPRSHSYQHETRLETLQLVEFFTKRTKDDGTYEWIAEKGSDPLLLEFAVQALFPTNETTSPRNVLTVRAGLIELVCDHSTLIYMFT